ncbi:MAG TPA: TonB-dependent receptor, partial [Rhodocyclaceae bacterium]
VQELGGSYSSAAISGRVSLYELELKDEIGFDSTTFANVNLPGTRRQGLETEVEVPLGRSLKLKLSYAYTDATFREGVNNGKTLPLAPRDNTALQLSWDAGVAGRYAAIVNAVGDRRYSGDFANVRGTLAGYTTLDLRADWDFKPWQITARVLNATDQRYAPFAGYSTFIADHYYYPADGRSFYLGARYAF